MLFTALALVKLMLSWAENMIRVRVRKLHAVLDGKLLLMNGNEDAMF